MPREHPRRWWEEFFVPHPPVWGDLPEGITTKTELLGFQLDNTPIFDQTLHDIAVEYGRTHDQVKFQQMNRYLRATYGIYMDEFDWEGFEEWYDQNNG